MNRLLMTLLWVPLASCQTITPPDSSPDLYVRTRVAEDIFEVKCKNKFTDPQKNMDICTLNVILWALENGYPYFVELEPAIKSKENHSGQAAQDNWTRAIVWGLKENPGFLDFMYDGVEVVDIIKKMYEKDMLGEISKD